MYVCAYILARVVRSSAPPIQCMCPVKCVKVPCSSVSSAFRPFLARIPHSYSRRRMDIHPTSENLPSRDCLESMRRVLDGESSVERNAKIEPRRAVFCA
jgi:hypothetical protein